MERTDRTCENKRVERELREQREHRQLKEQITGENRENVGTGSSGSTYSGY